MSRHRFIVLFLSLLLLLLAHGMALIYRVQPAVSLWFPPSGVAIAVTFWLGPVGILLTGIASVIMAPFWGSESWTRLVGLTDAIEPLVAWLFYHYGFRGSLGFKSIKDAIAFIVSIPLVACATSALVGSSALLLLGKLSADTWAESMGHWWLGNAIGAMAITPTLLLVFTPLLRLRRWLSPEVPIISYPSWQIQSSILKGRVEFTVILMVSLCTAWLVVLQSHGSSFALQHWSLLSFVPILWATIQFGTTGGMLVVTFSVFVTLLGYLLLHPHALALSYFPLNPELLHTHKLNLLVQCGVALLVGTAIAERTTAQVMLAQEQVQLTEYQAQAQLNRLLTEANQQLVKSEERFRTSVETMPDCFGLYSAIRDETGKILDFRTEYVNDAACINNHMTREEQIGKGLCELLPRHRDNGLFDEYCQVVETGQPLIKDALVYEDDYGQRRLVRAFDIRVAKLGDGFVATWRDISARKQTEAALRQSEAIARTRAEELETFMETVPAAVWIARDPYCHYMSANRTASELMRLPLGSVMTATPANGEYPFPFKIQKNGQDIPLNELPMQRAARTGEAIEAELDFVFSDSDVRSLYGKAVPLRDDSGGIRGAIGAFLDVTERKQAEAALRQKQEWLDVAQAAAKLGSFEWNIQTNVNTWSKELEALYGLEPGEFGGSYEDWAKWVHPDDLAKAEADVLSSLKSGEFFTDFRIIWRDGSIHWLHARARVFYDAEGKPLRMVGVNADISERKQAEEALQQSELRLRRLVDSNIMGVFFGNLNGNILEANDAFLQMVGYTRQELLTGQIRWDALTPPEHIEQTQQAVEELRATKVSTPFEKEFFRKDGSRIWVEIGSAMFDDGEEGLCCVIDLTKRKQAQEALRQSETRLKQLVESHIIGIIEVNLEQITFANDAFLNMVGYTREELLSGQVNWRDITPPEYAQQSQKGFEELLTSGVCSPFEKEYICKDGSRVPVLIGAVLLTRTPPHWMCFILDLTERKQAEAALRKSQESLSLALDATRMGSWDWDLQTNEIIWTPYHEMIFGYEPGTPKRTYQEWVNRVHPDDLPIVQAAVETAMVEYRDYKDEYRVLWPDGSVHWVSSFGRFQYDAAGQPTRMLGMLLEISDRKQIEAERADLLIREQVARQQAEAASRMKDEFLAIVSHELRSPLNGILGWSRLLRTRKLDAQKTEQALASIERNAQAQTQLIEDLLDISRIIRGTVRLNLHPTHLIPVIEAALDTVRPTASTKSIQVESHLDPIVSFVSGDPDRLQQIVWNLLSNAVKFTPQGGRVDIRLQQANGYAQIQVIDTGRGINPDFLPRVFERFRQADATTTRTQGGLGLGLAIVRNLVELHGGKIYAESQGEGQGATFTVELPLLPDYSNSSDLGNLSLQRQTASDTTLNLSGIKILAVDDEPDAREFLKTALEQYGAIVTTATSAHEAIQLLPTLKPDVLLSDIGMPIEDGYTLMRRVRSLPSEQGGQVPAAALTAYAREDDRLQALAAGFQMHVPKPIEPLQLLTVITRLARK